jgi:hypothetical protein
MWSLSAGVKSQACGLHSLPSAFFKSSFCLLIAVPLITGCASHRIGPDRPISVEEDVAYIRPVAEFDLTSFASYTPAIQASVRNQIVTARMYIADMEYHKYEARLTREMQDEGLAATLVSLGLTGSASLITVASTSRILSGIATVVTGADKAYNEKELLSNTIQALQTQMRADRKAEAAYILSRMMQDNGLPTPIGQYPLPMALSDADRYYQAGTFASALIGLTKTVTNAEQNASSAKDNAGPNPARVRVAKATAVPLPLSARPSVIRDVNVPLQRFNPPPPPPSPTRIGRYETTMSQKDMQRALNILGCSGTDLGPAGSPRRRALAKFLTDNGNPAAETLTDDIFITLRELKSQGKQGTCGA